MKVNPVVLILLAVMGFFLFRWLRSPKRQRVAGNEARRLARIRRASLVFQFLISFGLAVGIYSVLAFLLGWHFFSEYPSKIAICTGHVYTSPTEMPPTLLVLALLKIGLDFAAAAVLLALFGLYARGILFSPKNIQYIRFQGYYLILSFAVDYQIQSTLRDMTLSTTPLFVGLLIIFVAWIMDEGRKIQEEQELTV
jgi:hypothetical protein